MRERLRVGPTRRAAVISAPLQGVLALLGLVWSAPVALISWLAHRRRRDRPIRRAVAVVEAYAAVVKAAGVPMSAGFLAASRSRPVTAGSFATGVLVCTFWGTVLAMVLSKLSGRPRRASAHTLAALSLVVPVGAAATAASTKVTLAGGHVIVALLVIPILARAWPREAGREPGGIQLLGGLAQRLTGDVGLGHRKFPEHNLGCQGGDSA